MNLAEFDSKRGLTDGRILKSLAIAGGNPAGALSYAMGQAWGDTPRAVGSLEKSVMGVTGTGEGAGLALVPGVDLWQTVGPTTILGRLTGLRRVPFLCKLVAVIENPIGYWVGEGLPAPVSAAHLQAIDELARLKVVCMNAISEELARSSSPSATVAISRAGGIGIRSGMDSAFIDVRNAGIVDAKPASVTYGAPSFPSSGYSVAALDVDLQLCINSLIAYGSDLLNVAWIASPTAAVAIGKLRGTGGAPAYPGINARGGELLGLPVITSASVPRYGSPLETFIALVDGSQIWLADDSETSLETGKNATLQLLDNPTNASITGTPTTQTSMFTTSSIALRLTRWVNWQRAQAGAVAVLTNVGY